MRKAVSSHKIQRTSRGFSLVEVTLALGVISMSVIPLLGLMSVGLSQAKVAVDTQAESRIMQAVNSKVRQGNFLAVGAATSLYFDRQGGERPQAESLYRADISFENAGVAGQPVLINSLRRAKVVVRHAPGGTPTGAESTTNFVFVFQSGTHAP